MSVAQVFHGVSLRSKLLFIGTILLLQAGGLCFAYWVYLDATERTSDSAVAWAIGSLTVPLLPLGYLLYRHRIGGRPEPASRRERVVGTLGLAVVSGLVVEAQFAPPDPFTQIVHLPVAVFAAVPVSYWLVWRSGYARLRRRIGLVHEDEQRQ